MGWNSGLPAEHVSQIKEIMREATGEATGHSKNRHSGFWVFRVPSDGVPHIVVLRLRTRSGRLVREWVIADERGRYAAKDPVGVG